jgi:hypothetical protein
MPLGCRVQNERRDDAATTDAGQLVLDLQDAFADPDVTAMLDTASVAEVPGELPRPCGDQVNSREGACAKRAPWLELTGAYGDGRVCRAAPEEIAFRPSFVGRHPRVDRNGPAVEPELERQSVGMRVRREVSRRGRAAVECEPYAPVADDDVARLLEDGDSLTGLG